MTALARVFTVGEVALTLGMTLFGIGILGVFLIGGASHTGALVETIAGQGPEALNNPSRAMPGPESLDYFVPTTVDCPPRGECPRVKITVRHGDRDAFIRHLHLAVLRHGGSYDLYRQDDVFTVRLPQDAVAELRQLRAPWIFQRPVTEEYQEWAPRWSGESASAPAPESSDSLTAVTIKVAQESWPGLYAMAPVLFIAALLIPAAAVAGAACGRRGGDVNDDPLDKILGGGKRSC